MNNNISMSEIFALVDLRVTEKFEALAKPLEDHIRKELERIKDVLKDDYEKRVDGTIAMERHALTVEEFLANMNVILERKL